MICSKFESFACAFQGTICDIFLNGSKLFLESDRRLTIIISLKQLAITRTDINMWPSELLQN